MPMSAAAGETVPPAKNTFPGADISLVTGSGAGGPTISPGRLSAVDRSRI